MSGTSVATAVATGILASAWSMRSTAMGSDIRKAVARLGPRDGVTPPMLDRDNTLRELDRTLTATIAGSRPISRSVHDYVCLQGEEVMKEESALTTQFNRAAVTGGAMLRNVTPAHGADSCACGAPDGLCTCADAESSHFIYALGTVDVRCPDQSISEELQAVGRTINVVQRDDEDLRSWCYRVLTHPEGRKARYVARQLHWILRVEGQPAYHLILRDLDDLPDLISCLGRDEPDDQQPYDDLDLFVGRSTLTPVSISDNISAPMLIVEQICSFPKEQFVTWCTKSSRGPAKRSARRDKTGGNDRSASSGPKLFRMLVQSTDNFGDTDEWRALNFLAVRYKPIYEKYLQLADKCELVSIKVAKSRLAREKRIVDPVFAFQNRETGVVQRYFVRVDVSHLFPVLVTQLAEYFDR
jgi:hypothetical protein